MVNCVFVEDMLKAGGGKVDDGDPALFTLSPGRESWQ